MSLYALGELRPRIHRLAYIHPDAVLIGEVQIGANSSVWPGVVIEFAPELSGAGPKWHSMIREPGGCRLEFAWDPR